ncbi:MAG: hemolysin family protein [Microcystaceae cyanobacterium]
MDDLVGRSLLVLLLIGINAFFVTAEFSILAVRRSRINQLVESGDLPARSVQYFHHHQERLLSTTQLGITFSTLCLGWLSETTLAQIVTQFLLTFPILPAFLHLFAHAIAVPLTFLLIAYLQIVLGELVPKTIANLYAESLARNLAPSFRKITHLAKPFTWFLNHSTRWVLKRWGIESKHDHQTYPISVEELITIINTEAETIGLGETEQNILKNMFALGEITAIEIMVPRSQLVTISETATFGNLVKLVSEKGYSRYPVKGDSLDDIRGVIDFKDLAVPLSQASLKSDSPLTDWIKPIRFVPENTPLTDLLNSMQRSHLKTVIVVDEFGRTAGLLTLEDVITEILDARKIEENEDSLVFQMLDTQTFLVEAHMNLEDLNEVLGVELPLAYHYHTLAGFLLYKWQKIPSLGESLSWQNLTFTVEEAQGPKLNKIRIERSSDILPSENLTDSPLELTGSKSASS